MDSSELHQALRDKNIARIKQIIRDDRAPHLQDFRAGTIGGRALTQRLSAMIDHQVAVFAEHYLGEFKDQIALVFTGGNGRGEIHPYSDLDLMTLIPETLPAGFEEAYGRFYTALHDAGFVKPGLAVRSPADCTREAQNDQTIWTSLLDRRYLWGAQALYEDMNSGMNHLRDQAGQKLLAEKLEERGLRLGKMADSRYVLHPNVKEGRGGLRDYQTVLWIAHSAFGCEDMACFVEQRLLSEEERQRIEEAHDFLLTVRSHLHDLQDRPEDRLNAEIMPELVERYNASRPDETPETIESFMRQYFRHTREIGFFANIVSTAIEHQKRWFAPTKTVEEGRFEITDGHIRFKGNLADPVDMIRIFHAADEHGCKLDHSALRAIRAQADLVDDTTRNSPEANQLFMDILTCGDNASGLLRQMQETGLLQKFIPAFAHVDMLMQFDPYHVFTVDEHTFRCIDEMRGLENGDHAQIAPLAAEVFKNISAEDKPVLYTAMMLHDICKGRGGKHEELGTAYAQELCPRLGLDEEQTQAVSWLVQRHLLLSDTAFRYDPYDPATIENFSAALPSAKHLDLLVALTTADIMGVGPGRWNWNKAASISQLYENVKLYLDENALNEPPRTVLPEDYRSGETRIDIQNDPQRQVTVVTVITPDRDNLFEKLTGALSLLGANITDAKIETHDSPATAIDRFTIRTPTGEAYEEWDFDRIRKKIGSVLAPDNQLDIGRDLGTLSARHTKHRVYGLNPVIRFNNAASKDSTVLEIEARDRPELLYQLSRTFNTMGLDLRRAKVTLYGHKAADTFYLRDRTTGEKIAPERFEEITAALAASPAFTAK